MRESFSHETAFAAILYVLRARGGSATIHDLLKAMYFADKEHLSKFGWMASGDKYCAMTFGPVGSRTYDLLKAAGAQRNFAAPKYVLMARRLLDGSNYPSIASAEEPNSELLSPAFRECLDAAIAATSSLTFKERTDKSHDAAWDRARARWQDDGDMEMPIESIATTLPNANEVLEHIAAE